MNKAGNFGMALQQGLSFSPLLLRIPKGEAVFWPGCALMKLEPAILEKTMAILRREEPDLEIAAGCCGQPSVHLFPEQAEKRQEHLAAALKKQGVRRIYAACPNCILELRKLGDFEVIPIWLPLAKHMTKADLVSSEGRFVWHDPCPIRHDPSQLEAVRKLLALSGCDFTEPGNIRCCGNIHMLRATNPEQSAAIRRRRLAELEKDRTIASCCEGCLDAFRSEGRETCHLLELLFGRSKSRSWGNRFQNTTKAPL